MFKGAANCPLKLYALSLWPGRCSAIYLIYLLPLVTKCHKNLTPVLSSLTSPRTTPPTPASSPGRLEEEIHGGGWGMHNQAGWTHATRIRQVNEMHEAHKNILNEWEMRNWKRKLKISDSKNKNLGCKRRKWNYMNKEEGLKSKRRGWGCLLFSANLALQRIASIFDRLDSLSDKATSADEGMGNF